MVLIRMLKILFVTPFHPMRGFGLYQDDSRPQLLRRLTYYISFVGLMTLFYFMVYEFPDRFTDPPFFAWLLILFLKFLGILTFFFTYGITGLIMGFNEVMGSPVRMISALLAFTMLPEFVFVIGVYYFPEYYQEIRLLTYLWRAVLMVLGTYIMVDTPMKKAIIIVAISIWSLFFCNFNFFEIIENGY